MSEKNYATNCALQQQHALKMHTRLHRKYATSAKSTAQGTQEQMQSTSVTTDSLVIYCLLLSQQTPNPVRQQTPYLSAA